MPGVLVWSGCVAPSLVDPARSLTSAFRSNKPTDTASTATDAVAPSDDAEAKLVRETALKQGFSEADAEAYEQLLRTADPQARPFLMRLIYAQLYRASTADTAKSSPADTPAIGLTCVELTTPLDTTASRSLVVENGAGASQLPSGPLPTASAGTDRSDSTSDSHPAATPAPTLPSAADSRAGLLEASDPSGGPPLQRPTFTHPVTVSPTGALREDTSPSDTPTQWRRELRRIIAGMRKELDAAHSETEGLGDDEHARLRASLSLLYLVVDEMEQAMASLEGLDDQQLDFWRQTVMALGVLLEDDQLPKLRHRVDTATTHMYRGIRSLSTLGPLRVMNLAFCTKVNGFGDYVECDASALKPGAPVLLYVEVENFTVAEVDAGGGDRRMNNSSRRQPSATSRLPMYETELHGRYEILDANQRQIVARSLPVDRNVCRNHRRDYFIPYMLYLPEQITPGAYTLELTIEDKKGDKLGNAIIDFRIP